MIKEENIESIKKQLIEEIEKSIKGDQKNQIITQIKKMSGEELENFLKKNSMIRDPGKCIFCSIIDGDLPTYKLIENNYAIATLEINPISKGHTLIIPKTHSEEIAPEVKNLAAEISEHLKFLKPKTIEIIPTSLFGHTILNAIPIYSDETIKSKRTKADQAELIALQGHIREQFQKKKNTKKETKPEPKKEEIITDKNTWLPNRKP